jgi:hypothetical protein
MPTFSLRKAQANASKIGVTVKRSTRAGKKLDVFKDGKKVASIGDVNYKDFSVTGDKDRQRAYKARFAKTRNKVGTPSYYADRVLWS